MTLRTRVLGFSFALALAGATLAAACPGMTNTAQNGDHPGCAKAGAHPACCAHGQAATASMSGDKVSFEGIVQCAHCDLHQSEHCQTLLKTADGKTITLVPGPRVQDLRQQAGHGARIVRVKGVQGDDGAVAVKSFKVLGKAPAAPATATQTGM